GHGWTARPGCNVFMADRGAVRFDFPKDWVVIPGGSSIKFHDRQPPADDCTLQVSVLYLPDIDWSGLPLSFLVRQLVANDSRDIFCRGEIVEVRRPRLELAWTEVGFIDPNERQEARSRTCLARWSNIQPLITFDFWAEHAPRVDPVWEDVL